MKRFVIASALLLLLAPVLARAAEPVFFSEAAWAGSAVSTADEWLEVCGPPGTDLSGWRIEGAAGNGLRIPDGSLIPASEAFLIANYGADDPKTTLAAVPSWVTTAVALSNASLHLILYDATGSIIDTAGASGTAPLAGTSGSVKASMERLFPLGDGVLAASWKSAEAASGFDPGAAELGSPGTCTFMPEAPEAPNMPTEEATSTLLLESEVAPPTAPPLAPTTAIRISEIYPSPRSGEQEWIELVNPSAIGEVLDDWTLEDGKGTATHLSGTLLPWQRLVLFAPKGSLNNDGDLVILKDGQGRIIDGVAYGGWETALYPRVGEIAKGASVIRLELQETFDVTTVPTPDAANVLLRAAIEAPAPSAVSAAAKTVKNPETQEYQATAPTEKMSGLPPARALAETVKKESPPSKTSKRQVKAPAGRYKGASYIARIAVPVGVYGKTKMYVLIEDALRELRLSKSPGAVLPSGQSIAFVAQTKSENGEEFLLANPNSMRALDRAASSTFATIDRWPETADGYRFSAEVVGMRGGSLEVELGGVEGDIVLPKALPGLKPGDRVEIEGFIAPGARPRVVLADARSIRVFASPPAESVGTPSARPRLPWSAMIALTSAVGGFGLALYLRHERLKRLALAMQPIEDEIA